MTAPQQQRQRPVVPVVAPIATVGLVAHAEALRNILADLGTVTVSRLVELFRQYETDPNFPAVLRLAFPEIIRPHAQAAATITAQWYNEITPASTPPATPVVDLPAERIDKTINWSLYAPTTEHPVEKPRMEASPARSGGSLGHREIKDLDHPEMTRSPGSTLTLERLSGSAKRMVFDASRHTVVDNAAITGTRWARYAQPDACAFCRVLATRTGMDSEGRNNLYTSEKSAERVVGRNGSPRGSRQIGERYHDHCRCVAVPVPPGDEYEPPDYTKQWEQDYREAFNAVPSGTTHWDNGFMKAVVAHMRANTDAA